MLVLTARGTWTDRVDGIDAGADDYLPKPFRMEELMARLRALLRRSAGRAEPVDLGRARHARSAHPAGDGGGMPVTLTPLEFRLLNYLFHHRGRVVSQAELSENLYSHDSERDSNAIEALVGRLRTKLKADVIETRRGFGYIVPAAGAHEKGSLRLRLFVAAAISIAHRPVPHRLALVRLFEAQVRERVMTGLENDLLQLPAAIEHCR